MSDAAYRLTIILAVCAVVVSCQWSLVEANRNRAPDLFQQCEAGDPKACAIVTAMMAAQNGG